MSKEKLTIEDVFDKSLVIAENLRLDFIQFPYDEHQMLINKRFSEFREIQESFLKQIRENLYKEKIQMNVPIYAISRIFADYLNLK